MEEQLRRVLEKREQRLEVEKKVSKADLGRKKQIASKSNHIKKLKREIEAMWYDLEYTFAITEITKLENEMRAKKNELAEMYMDNKYTSASRKAQNQVLKEKQ